MIARAIKNLAAAVLAAFLASIPAVAGVVGTVEGPLGGSHIPFVVLASGSFGNNGAYTTSNAAVLTAYPNAYCSVPAGAIATSTPAAQAWYYCVFSSTTAATLYNNTYSTGTPTIPGSPTAFATTGPGAFTQSTGQITAYQLSIAGNTIGAQGALRITTEWTNNNSANSKTFKIAFGGSSLNTAANTTNQAYYSVMYMANVGATNSQISSFLLPQATSGAPTRTSIDTTSAQTLQLVLQLATATDNICLEASTVELIPSTPF